MSDVALTVENLSKKYILGHQNRERYTALRDVLANQARNLGKRLASPFKATNTGYSKEEFWALKDVSFEVKKGDVVGIIGRNGAGKSTLLKILSQITEPTTGRITIEGQVASLLEVGTGFHPELTGRENIFLNGAILGMSRADIKRKFDEIVDFAEIEKFLDTPVKRYSSGMYVRLAFAVAAHMEPEILVVDEVLAVGDAAFQKKCLGKMEDVANKEGRTVLFVSHNMAAIENLCHYGILLDRGQLKFNGPKIEAIRRYQTTESDSNLLDNTLKRDGSGQIRVQGIEIKDIFGNNLDILSAGQTIKIYLHYKAEPNVKLNRVIASISFKTQFQVPVFLQHNRMTGDDFGTIPSEGSFVCTIPKLPLPESTYNLEFSIQKDGEILDYVDNACSVQVTSGDFFGTGETPPISHGLSLVEGSWQVEFATAKVNSNGK